MSSAYLNFTAKRLFQAGAVVLLAYVLTFVMVSILPGDPITSVLRNPENGFTEDEIREIISAQGLDKPIPLRLWLSLSHFVTGDFGVSMRSSRPVSTLIDEVLPSTLHLASAGLAVALVLAFAVAYGAKFLPNRYAQGALRTFPSLSLAAPNFVIGLALIHIFGFRLGLFRVIEPESFWATAFAAIALGVPVSARIGEVLIANLDNESAQEYAAVARSRGLGQIQIFARHLLKPSSLPVVTVIALTIGELLGGSLITEAVFGRTGVGSLVRRSVVTHDLPVLQAIVSLAAVVFVVVNLMADLVYPLLDPRVKLLNGSERRRVDESEAAPEASSQAATA